MACLDPSGQDASTGLILGLEDDGASLKAQHRRADASLLDDRAFGGEVATQDGESSVGGVGVGDAMDDGFVFDLGAADIAGQGVPRHRGALGVEQALDAADLFDDGTDAAGTVDVFDMVVRRGGDLADVGALLRDGIDALEVVVDARLLRDRQCVQHGVGAAAHGHVDGEGVVDGGERDDVAGQRPVLLGHGDDALGGITVELFASWVGRQHGAVAGQCDADGLAEAVHGVSREHSRAGADRGTGAGFDAL